MMTADCACATTPQDQACCRCTLLEKENRQLREAFRLLTEAQIVTHVGWDTKNQRYSYWAKDYFRDERKSGPHPTALDATLELVVAREESLR